MSDNQIFKQIEDGVENIDFDRDCGVAEELFPWIERCCLKSSSLASDLFTEKCPHCTVWTSLPDGGNLTITHILECSRYGYGKRFKE